MPKPRLSHAKRATRNAIPMPRVTPAEVVLFAMLSPVIFAGALIIKSARFCAKAYRG